MQAFVRVWAIALAGVALLSARAPAQNLDPLVSGGILGAFGNKNINEEIGFAWRFPEVSPVADDMIPATNRWDRPYPFKIRAASPGPISSINSGLELSTDGAKKVFFPEPDSLWQATKEETTLLATGSNVRKLNALKASDLLKIAGLGEGLLNEPDPQKRLAILARYRNPDAGLFAIPDKSVVDAAKRLAIAASNANTAGNGRWQIKTNEDAQAAQLICKYLATNQELAIYRSMVSDGTVKAKLDALEGLVFKKDRQGGVNFSCDVTNPDVKKAVLDLKLSLGIVVVKAPGDTNPTAGLPTADEIRGIYNLRNYFAIRENPAGLTVTDVNGRARTYFGEAAAGSLLDSRATQSAADLFRYSGTNPRPLPLTPAEIATDKARGSIEKDNEPPHTWLDVAKSVMKSVREGTDRDAKAPERGGGGGRPDNDRPRKK